MINIYSYESPLFWTLFYVWFILEIFFGVRARYLQRGQPKRNHNDRGSGALIMGGMYILIVISIIFVVNQIGILPIWARYIGYFLMIIGMIIRFFAIIQLGRFFSPTVGVVSNQEMIQSGLYRSIRHPAYTGGWIAAVGIGLSLGTSWGALLLGLGLLLIYTYRIRIEEQMMIQHFGNQYTEYRNHTKRMFPGIW
ncbi:methyltransferase family protein [Sulfoacidibacillus ferrooxidans]|uniref:Isoprenylcysteine carboxylmethyltransferase family protein n=1 Tax=Sulfoacidibacillus ferrooxidans TaxID=2005001 RepID=A0A9X2ABI9_9BACL|nr:isoprenylcysteine carboxylmethyltransferase family protein [Sulfoacidibacillus ferrooxidans]MCI0183053.1 hypothetical protein [Sulfoacidibacillus ferrooxidans]